MYGPLKALHPALRKLTAAVRDATACRRNTAKLGTVHRPKTPSLGRRQGDGKFEAGLGCVVSSSPVCDTQLDTVSRRGGSGGGEQGKRNIHGSHGTAADTAGRGGLLLALRLPVPPFSSPGHKCAARKPGRKQVPTPAAVSFLLLQASVVPVRLSWGAECRFVSSTL